MPESWSERLRQVLPELGNVTSESNTRLSEALQGTQKREYRQRCCLVLFEYSEDPVCEA